jgi:hypothetical protein
MCRPHLYEPLLQLQHPGRVCYIQATLPCGQATAAHTTCDTAKPVVSCKPHQLAGLSVCEDSHKSTQGRDACMHSSKVLTIHVMGLLPATHRQLPDQQQRAPAAGPQCLSPTVQGGSDR